MESIIGKGNAIQLNGFYYSCGLGYYYSAGYLYCKKEYHSQSNEFDNTLYYLL